MLCPKIASKLVTDGKIGSHMKCIPTAVTVWFPPLVPGKRTPQKAGTEDGILCWTPLLETLASRNLAGTRLEPLQGWIAFLFLALVNVLESFCDLSLGSVY